jgi:endonuclease G, mitochondrial
MTSRSLRLSFLGWFAILGLAIATQAEDYLHLLFGNPNKATDDKKDKDNYLIQKEYFAVGYNNSKGTPNWVSWQLAKEHMDGDAPRKRVFDSESLPKGFNNIYSQTYTGS